MTRPPIPDGRLPRLMYVLRTTRGHRVHAIYPTQHQAEEARRQCGDPQTVEIVVYSGPNRVPTNN